MNKLSLPSGNVVRHADPFLEVVMNAQTITDVLPNHVAGPADHNYVAMSKVIIGVGLSALPSGMLVSKAFALPQSTELSFQANDVSRPTIVIVGDSLTVGRKSAGIVDRFASVGIDVTDIEAKSGVPTSYGLKELDDSHPSVVTADVVVIALGTNSSSNFQAELLHDIKRANQIGMEDGKQPLIAIPELMGESSRVRADERNPIIYQAVIDAQAEGINAVVLPYREFGKTQKFDSMLVHPQNYNLLVDHDIEQIAPLAIEQHQRLFPAATSTVPSPPPPLSIPGIGSMPIIPSEPTPGKPPEFTPTRKNESFILDLTSYNPASSLPSLAEAVSSRTKFVSQPITLVDIRATVAPLKQAAVASVLPAREPSSSPATANQAPTVNDALPATPPTAKASVVLVDIRLPEKNPEIGSATVPFQLPSINALTANDKPAPSTSPEVIANNTGMVPSTTPTDATKPVVNTEVPAVNEISSLYSVNAGNVLDDSGLRNMIRTGQLGFRKAAISDTFPAGDYYRIPDSINGLPYEFSNETTYNERFASEKTASIALLVVDKVKQLQLKYPGLENVVLMDATSTHIEHKNGGDIDVGLISDINARSELFLYLISLRNADGSSYIHHIITGDKKLKEAGDAYLKSMGYNNQPRIIYQEDHGKDPGPTSHWHISGDGGANGPFDQPAANVPLNGKGEAPLEGVAAAQPATSSTDIPINNNDKVTPPASTITPIIVDLSSIASVVPVQPKGGNTDTSSPEPAPGTSNSKVSASSDSTVTDSTTTTVANPKTPVPTDPSIVTPPQDVHPAEGAPISDIFNFDMVQAMLPGASAESITKYTPLILSALNELGIADRQMALYAFATISVETGGFKPIPEYGLGHGKKYGEIDQATGQAYYGRGFIQLTWRSNYERAGHDLGIDLVNNPDLALDPTTAARILAWYLKGHESEIRDALNNDDLKKARQIVNGNAAYGLKGFSDSYLAGKQR